MVSQPRTITEEQLVEALRHVGSPIRWKDYDGDADLAALIFAALPAEPQPQTAVALLRELVEAVRSGDPSGAWTVREEEAIHAARTFLASQSAAQSGPAGGEGLDVDLVRQTIANLRDAWGGEDDSADAFIAEYDRLKAPATEGGT